MKVQPSDIEITRAAPMEWDIRSRLYRIALRFEVQGVPFALCVAFGEDELQQARRDGEGNCRTTLITRK